LFAAINKMLRQVHKVSVLITRHHPAMYFIILPSIFLILCTSKVYSIKSHLTENIRSLNYAGDSKSDVGSNWNGTLGDISKNDGTVYSIFESVPIIEGWNLTRTKRLAQSVAKTDRALTLQQIVALMPLLFPSSTFPVRQDGPPPAALIGGASATSPGLSQLLQLVPMRGNVGGRFDS
jgi:hypothetical protein